MNHGQFLILYGLLFMYCMRNDRMNCKRDKTISTLAGLAIHAVGWAIYAFTLHLP